MLERLKNFPLHRLMLTRGKGCDMPKLFRKAQHFLQHQSIPHGILFQCLKAEERNNSNCRDDIFSLSMMHFLPDDDHVRRVGILFHKFPFCAQFRTC